jgi:hypothetical protein
MRYKMHPVMCILDHLYYDRQHNTFNVQLFIFYIIIIIIFLQHNNLLTKRICIVSNVVDHLKCVHVILEDDQKLHSKHVV